MITGDSGAENERDDIRTGEAVAAGEEPRTRVCALDGCGQRFVPASNRQKFCTPAHQQQAQALRRRPVDPELPLAELGQIRDDAVATVVPAAEALTRQLTTLLERLTTIDDSAVARIAAAETALAEARAAQQDAAERAADADAARERAERQSRIDAAARATAETDAAAAARDAENSRADQHRAEIAAAASERDARWLAEQLTDLRDQHAALTAEHDDLKTEHEALTAKHTELARTRDADRATHTQALHELELRHRDQLADAQQAHTRELAEAERRHTADREQLTQRHHDETARLRAEHTTELDRLTTELEQTRARDAEQRRALDEQARRIGEHERAAADARTLARDYTALYEIATNLAATEPDAGRDIRLELAAAVRGRSMP